MTQALFHSVRVFRSDSRRKVRLAGSVQLFRGSPEDWGASKRGKPDENKRTETNATVRLMKSYQVTFFRKLLELWRLVHIVPTGCHFSEGNMSMLKYYIQTTEALKQLRSDVRGVVSFEYVIVAACIVAAVALAFGQTGPLVTALTNALSTIGDKVTTAVNAA
jgi:Flp pilus assembly pilin Flp